MLATSRTPLTAVCRCAARRTGPSLRQLSTRAAPRTNHAAWMTATAVSGSLLAYSLYNMKPELVPAVLPTVHAEVAPSTAHYIDPTTSTPFPTSIVSPDGKKLALVGTGVRTVSFLSIRVYAAAYYVEESTLRGLARVKGFQSYKPDQLLPPFAKTDTEVRGEALMGILLDVADVSVIIVPLRNTTLPHLRDGFSRALVARMKLPHVAESMNESESEAAAASLTELKGFFPGRTLPKGSPLELYYSSADRTVLFQTKDAKDGPADVLGTLKHKHLAKELFLSYFSDTLETSPELRKSVALGLAGEPRTAVAPAPTA